MNSLWKDIRVSLRGFRRSPAFAIAVVLTLALGTGANAAIFSIVNALLLRPLPVSHPERLVQFVNHDDGSAKSWSYPDFADYRKGMEKLVSGMSVYWLTGVTLRGQQAPTRIQAAAVSSDFFEVIGIRATRGRVFFSGESRANAPADIAVLSKTFWQQRFGGDRGVVGRTINLDHRPLTIVGIVDAERVITALGRPQIFIPLHAVAAMQTVSLEDRGAEQYRVFSRLKPGVSAANVQLALDVEGRRLSERYRLDAQRHVTVTPSGTLGGLQVTTIANLKNVTELLWIGAVIVLLIACANIMNLFLARAVRQVRELAIRTALGAGWLSLVRQLLTESLLLCLGGMVVGIGLAQLGLVVSRRFPAIAAIAPTLDGRVLLYTLALTCAASMLFGVAPFVAAFNPNIAATLTTAHAVATRKHRRMRRSLAVGQVALSVALLAAVGLVSHTLINLSSVRIGFNPQNVLVTWLHFPPNPEQSSAPAMVRLDQLGKAVKALPDVTAAGFATSTPLDCCRMIYDGEVPGYTPKPNEEVDFDVGSATDGFFGTLGVPIILGRGFNGLGGGDTKAVVINEAMARHYWQDRDPVGSRIYVQMAKKEAFRVVGVVQDFHDHGIDHSIDPMMYWRYPTASGSAIQMVIRSSKDTAALRADIAKTVHAVEPTVIVGKFEAMDSRISDLFTSRNNVLWCLGIFGGIALLLAAVGLYGVITYDMAQRRIEVGIRMALGATPAGIVWLALRQVAVLLVCGVVLGAGAALAASHALRHYLFDVIPADPASFFGSAAILFIIGLLAALVPALRAAKRDPEQALRCE